MNKEPLSDILAIAIALAFVGAIIYLLISAVFLEWNPVAWPVVGRFLALGLLIFAGAKMADGK